MGPVERASLFSQDIVSSTSVLSGGSRNISRSNKHAEKVTHRIGSRLVLVVSTEQEQTYRLSPSRFFSTGRRQRSVTEKSFYFEMWQRKRRDPLYYQEIEDKAQAFIYVELERIMITYTLLTPLNLPSLRRYVTNLKVAGSRPDEVNDFYHVT
jgi:hypothetical protein